MTKRCIFKSMKKLGNHFIVLSFFIDRKDFKEAPNLQSGVLFLLFIFLSRLVSYESKSILLFVLVVLIARKQNENMFICIMYSQARVV